MSVIAIKGIPVRKNAVQIKTLLLSKFDEKFEILNIEEINRANVTYRICYMRILDSDQPKIVVDRFNSKSKGLMRAYIPKNVPNYPPSEKASFVSEEPAKVLIKGHYELMNELQYKYTELMNVNETTGNKLIEKIALIILVRLQNIIKYNPYACNTDYLLTKLYRKSHPHFADFQCILTQLHTIEDEMGKTRTQMAEGDLIKVSTSPNTDETVPQEELIGARKKYSELISLKLQEHTKTLMDDPIEGDNEDMVARKKIRTELRRLSPCFEDIVKQVIQNHVKLIKTHYFVRVYGEPAIASPQILNQFLNKHCPGVKAARSKRMFNLASCTVPFCQYSNLMAMDGNVIGGSKLIIRPEIEINYKMPKFILDELKKLGKTVVKTSETFNRLIKHATCKL